MIEGRVIQLNQASCLAVADIGCGQALVLQFPPDALLDIGDHIQGLVSGYRTVNCLNLTKQYEMSIVVLANSLPMQIASFVVNEQNNASQPIEPVSQVA